MSSISLPDPIYGTKKPSTKSKTFIQNEQINNGIYENNYFNEKECNININQSNLKILKELSLRNKNSKHKLNRITKRKSKRKKKSKSNDKQLSCESLDYSDKNVRKKGNVISPKNSKCNKQNRPKNKNKSVTLKLKSKSLKRKKKKEDNNQKNSSTKYYNDKIDSNTRQNEDYFAKSVINYLENDITNIISKDNIMESDTESVKDSSYLSSSSSSSFSSDCYLYYQQVSADPYHFSHMLYDIPEEEPETDKKFNSEKQNDIKL